MAQQSVYILYGDFISAETSPSTPLYHLSKSLASLTHKDSSLYFSRIIVNDTKTSTPDSENQQPQQTPLYSLVHPKNAHYRTDIPAPYFMTNNSPVPALGNIKFVPSFTPSLTKKFILPFHKPTFTAFLSPSSTSSSSPLFPESDASLEVLFTAKPSRGGRVWEWLDASGKEVVAREEAGDKKQQLPPRLVVEGEASLEMRDALVALWVLRLWWSVAEEKDFQNEVIMNLTPPESISYNGDINKMNKRIVALGALGAC
ncbi:hypothetical protein B0T16DRAFT_406784 [Cercophora newfieldiana]|uniref:Uncharacterized protein n=1 Tax=Cercophora newfieldiana TaxID=92897 RepID=A0AA39YHP1_9PEZI|nr:hypothetical protein B0T16DRAFT_406784 [Cercophora newfieldiana]